MSYPRDLNEIPERELIFELRRRRQARRQGVCDYCGRYRQSEPCRFVERHQAVASQHDFEVI